MKYYFNIGGTNYQIQNPRIIQQIKAMKLVDGDYVKVVDSTETNLQVKEIKKGYIIFDYIESNFIDRSREGVA